MNGKSWRTSLLTEGRDFEASMLQRKLVGIFVSTYTII